MMDKNSNTGVKGLADMDTRLAKLNKRVGEMEDVLSKLEKVRGFFFIPKPNKLLNINNISLLKLLVSITLNCRQMAMLMVLLLI